MNEFKKSRSGINGIYKTIAEFSIVIKDLDKAEEYKNDCNEILKWIDEVENFIYEDN